MSGRLIVVSNRAPAGGPPDGGLVVALHDCLSVRGGLWIGSNEDMAPTDALVPSPSEAPYDTAWFHVSPREREEYYLGYANSVLWPLFHRRTDLMSPRRADAETYAAVNARLARAIAAEVRPDDLIWIHDYHFLPLAQNLRELGVGNRIGLFLHIPFPTSTDLYALPERDAFYRWIAAFDVVGLQTSADVARCLEAFRAHPEGEFMPDGRVKFGGRVFDLRSFPIGIDVDAFRAEATPGGRSLLRLADDEKFAIGVDRLDYSKGLPNRFAAFGEWLSRRTPDDPRLTLLQIAPPSRSEVTAYRDMAGQLQGQAGRINGAYATLDWTPIRLLIQKTPRETLARLYRAADIGLVTPLADGMNLVAKEFVAAQFDDDPGVLILSRNAGAAESLTDALIVNPFDASEIADAIAEAAVMSLAERQDRQASLLAAVRATDIASWSDRYLSVLEACDHADLRLSA